MSSASPGPRARARAPASPTRPPTGSQARAERTRASVIDETVRCVLEEGFAAASAKHIAERAGVSWGVIQYHFGDRDGLLAAVLDEGLAHLRATVAGLEVPDGDSRQRARAVVDATWAAFATPISRASLEIVIATRSRRGSDFEAHLAAMADDLARLGASLLGDDDPDHALGDLLWAALRGLVVRQMSVARPVDVARELDTLVDVLTVYLERRRA